MGHTISAFEHLLERKREEVVMGYERKPKLLMAKHILDGHDRGVKAAMTIFRDMGIEVVYIIFRKPEDVVEAAKQEDADIIGLSFSSGAYFEIIPILMDSLKLNDMHDIAVVVGGLIPEYDKPELTRLGIKGIFGPGDDLMRFADLAAQVAGARVS